MARPRRDLDAGVLEAKRLIHRYSGGKLPLRSVNPARVDHKELEKQLAADKKLKPPDELVAACIAGENRRAAELARTFVAFNAAGGSDGK